MPSFAYANMSSGRDVADCPPLAIAHPSCIQHPFHTYCYERLSHKSWLSLALEPPIGSRTRFVHAYVFRFCQSDQQLTSSATGVLADRVCIFLCLYCIYLLMNKWVYISNIIGKKQCTKRYGKGRLFE